MNSKDYVKEILDRLMKKYQNRAPRREGMKSQRRVMLKPAALYRHYADNNADISVKQEIHEAVDKLLDLVMLFVGGLAAYTFVWDLGDVGIGLMTVFNIAVIIPMSKEALASLREYESARKKR